MICMKQLSEGAKHQVLKMSRIDLFQDLDGTRNLGEDNDHGGFSVNPEASHVSCAVLRLN